MSKFGDWLLGEIRKRGMTQAELARDAGISRASITDVITGRRNPGKDLSLSVARALKVPPEQVYRIAGLLPPAHLLDEEMEKIVFEVSKLHKHDQEEVLAFIRMKARLRKNRNGSKR